MKYLATLYGIDESPFQLLAVGSAPRAFPARENQVDASSAAPDADEVALEGIGEFYLSFATEIPAFKDFPYTVLIVPPEFASTRPEAVRGIARSIGEANDFIQTNFGEALDMLKAEFPKIDGRAIVSAYGRNRLAFRAAA